ncbi:MAG: hypothetical protein KIB11_10375 [Clostridium perfringens]|nr:hypothetical protein [Clostridium perfringens]
MEFYEFNKYEEEGSCNLEGGTLFVDRYNGSHGSLQIKLFNVGEIEFFLGDYDCINAKVFNTSEDVIAILDEFKKTKTVYIKDINYRASSTCNGEKVNCFEYTIFA